MAIDIVKGTAAVLLAHLSPYVFDTNEFVNLELGLGVAVIVGHVFPIFAGFRGGKGVATILGIVICLTPLTSLMVLAVFLIVLLATRYVSLSSMTAGLSFPFFLNIVLKNQNQTLLIFSLFVAALLIITHKKYWSFIKTPRKQSQSFCKKGIGFIKLKAFTNNGRRFFYASLF